MAQVMNFLLMIMGKFPLLKYKVGRNYDITFEANCALNERKNKMNLILYTIIIIAISVTLSTIINVVIMRKVSEMAATELQKMESRWFKLIDKIIDQ